MVLLLSMSPVTAYLPLTPCRSFSTSLRLESSSANAFASSLFLTDLVRSEASIFPDLANPLSMVAAMKFFILTAGTKARLPEKFRI